MNNFNWDAFFEGMSSTAWNSVKVFVVGFFVFWASFTVFGSSLAAFVIAHLILLGYWAYLFRWFK